MPCAAEKTFCDPATSLERQASIPDASHLTLVDKSQVIALALIRQKIVENADDLIRRKFSIDAKLWRAGALVPHPPIRNHNGGAFGNPPFTICARKRRKWPERLWCFATGWAALAFV
jgi:hypothetical protein